VDTFRYVLHIQWVQNKYSKSSKNFPSVALKSELHYILPPIYLLFELDNLSSRYVLVHILFTISQVLHLEQKEILALSRVKSAEVFSADMKIAKAANSS